VRVELTGQLIPLCLMHVGQMLQDEAALLAGDRCSREGGQPHARRYGSHPGSVKPAGQRYESRVGGAPSLGHGSVASDLDLSRPTAYTYSRFASACALRRGLLKGIAVRFTRFGRTTQLRIETADDLEAVLSLDESLWMATSAPVGAFSCDREFLAFVDSDGNGRIQTNELKEAIGWLLDRLADRSRLPDGVGELPMAAIRSDTPAGRALVESGEYVLDQLGRRATESLSLDDVRVFAASVHNKPLNGDGVIVPAAAHEADVKAFIEDVAACMGPVTDASGRTGINEETLSAFLAAAQGYLDWKAKGEVPADGSPTQVMPLGEATPAAYAVYRAHAPEIETFFALCNAVRFQPKIAGHVDLPDADLVNLTADGGRVQEALAKAPIARPDADGRLPLADAAVNPLYRAWLADLKKQVLEPVLGAVPEKLDEEAWAKVAAFFAPYEAYLAGKQGAQVESLPERKLREYLADRYRARVGELIQADKNVAVMMEGLKELKKLLLYHQHIMRLANNFVSFPELYGTDTRALFEMGSAVIDGRWFNFCTRVDDVAAHAAVAGRSSVFCVYLEVTGREADEKFTVVAPATSGTKGNLDAGKRGVFFDVNGREYDARIVRIITNPISLREALASPFVRLWNFILGKIESLTSKAEKGLEQGAGKVLAAPMQQGAAASPAGLFVGVGVAIAALSSAFAYIVKTFAGLGHQKLLLGIGAVLLVVLAPVTLLAVLKLRRRDLSNLLEGSGWAINARMRLNRAQRRFFTRRVPYPKGAEGAPTGRWKWVIAIAGLLLVLGAAGYIGVQVFRALFPPGAEQSAPEPPGQKGEADRE